MDILNMWCLASTNDKAILLCELFVGGGEGMHKIIYYCLLLGTNTTIYRFIGC